MSKPSDNIPLPPKVAVDRYKKRLRDEDLNRGEANYAKSAVAGGLAGLALKLKRGGPSGTGISPGKRAAIGAAAGVLAEGVIRRVGARTKDFYGERSRTAKKTEKIPVVAGLTAAGILARRRTKALSRFEFSIPSSLKRKLAAGVALAGGIAVADSATRTIFPDKDQSRKAAAGKGLAEGAVYGSVLAGVEPQLLAKIRRHFERPIGPIAIADAPYYFIRNVDPAEDLRSQRRKLAVLGGGAVAATVGLGLLARSGSKSRVVADLAQSLKKVPAGRGTVARLAESNALRTERGYVHLKPMAPGQRKRFDKLPEVTQKRAGAIAAHTGNQNFSPDERRQARQMLGAFRKKHNFRAGLAVVEFADDPIGIAAAIAKLARLNKARGAGAVLPRVVKPGFAGAEKRLAKRMWPARLVPQREFGMYPAGGVGPSGTQIVIVRKTKADRERDAFQHKIHVAEGVTGTAAGGIAIGAAAAKLAKWIGRRGVKNLAADSGKTILFKRQQLREKEGDRFADPLYAAATGQHVYAHTENGERRSYGGDNAPLPLAHAQVLRAAYHKAGRVHKWGGRALATASDVGDVIGGRPRKVDYAGRPKKREWEKPYAKRVAETAALGAGVLGGALILKKSPRLRAKVMAGSARVREKVNRSIPDFFAGRKFTQPVHELARRNLRDLRQEKIAGVAHKTVSGKVFHQPLGSTHGDVVDRMPLNEDLMTGGDGFVTNKGKFVSRRKAQKLALRAKQVLGSEVNNFLEGPHFKKFSVHELAARFIAFDDLANFAGWDVRDPRGRSARVFAPGSRRRMRRDKEWHETAEGQRKIRNALVAATAVAAGGAGVLAGRHLLPKKARLISEAIKPRVLVPVKF